MVIFIRLLRLVHSTEFILLKAISVFSSKQGDELNFTSLSIILTARLAVEISPLSCLLPFYSVYCAGPEEVVPKT